MPCSVLHMFAVYLSVSSPLLFLVGPDTAVGPEYHYNHLRGSSSTKQPGKQTPLDHPYIGYSFPLMLALDFATVLVTSYPDA